MIVVGIDEDLEVVGDNGVVAPDEHRLDRAGRGVEQAGADVERVGPDEHAYLGALRRRLPRLRIELCERGHRGRARPGRLVEPAVDLHIARRPSGSNFWRRIMDVGQGCGDCITRLGDREQQETR